MPHHHVNSLHSVCFVADLSFNKLVTPPEDDPYAMVEFAEGMPALKSLDLRGNPVVDAMTQYRSVMATRVGDKFEVLDGEPMTPEERKVAKESTKLQFWLEQKAFTQDPALQG